MFESNNGTLRRRLMDIKNSLSTTLRHLKQTAVRLRRHPRSALVIAFSLALGVTANTMMFSVYRGITNPKHYVRLDELVRIKERVGPVLADVSGPSFRDMQDESRTLSAVGAYKDEVFAVSEREGQQEVLSGALVSAGLLGMLEIQPVLGRVFVEEEFRPGGEESVIISFSYWRSRFAARNDVYGSSLTINGRSHVIVGVMPEGFLFPWDSDIWVPWTALERETDRTNRSIQVLGRLASNVSIGTAADELSQIVVTAIGTSQRDGPRYGVTLTPMAEELSGGRVTDLVWLLFSAAGFVMLVVCLNVSAIQSADFVSRQRETATVLALGASKGEVIRRCLTESVLVALAGGVIGVLGAHWALIDINVRYDDIIPYWVDLSLDRTGLLYTVAVCFLVGVIAGMQPARLSSRTPLEALRGGLAGTKKSAAWMKFLVSAQVAAAVLLLVGTHMSLSGVGNLEAKDLGFEIEGRRMVSIPLLSERYGEPEIRYQAATRILESLRSAAAVKQAAAVRPAPLTFPMWTYPVGDAIGRESDEAGRLNVVDYACTRDYFAASGTALLAGTSFRDTADAASSREIVVNNRLAMHLAGGDPVAAIGMSIRVWGEQYTVVGVAVDSYHTPAMTPAPLASYRSLATAPPTDLYIVMESDLPAGALQSAVNAAAAKYDATLATTSVTTMEDQKDNSISFASGTARLLGMFSVFAILLTLVGIYGMASSMVAWQRREHAIRRAIGLTDSGLVLLLCRDIGRLAVIGTILGIVASVLMTPVLEGTLLGVSRFPPTGYLTVVLAIASTGLLATFIPAWSATRVGPWETLRSS